MTDAAGNVGAAGPVLSIVVDPLAAGSDGARSRARRRFLDLESTDNITNVQTGLTISGVSEPNSGVNLFDGSNFLATVNADSNGVFTVDVSLELNPHSITARSSDIAGNISPSSVPLVLTIVNALPSSSAVFDGSTTTFG